MRERHHITQELLQEYFDYKDGQLTRKIKTSNRAIMGVPAGTLAKNGYYMVSFQNKRMYVHRLIYLWNHGHLPKYIDHIDGNPKNNSLDNLREASQVQNCANHKLSKRNTSGISGVCWDKKANRWMARIAPNRNELYLGHFSNFFDACCARKSAELKHFGEFQRK